MKNKVRVIAMYLPQFHPIRENDEWWGKGFTEWTNVASAKPLFRGHYQPRVPADLGFYDLRLTEVREAQAEMARDAGIEGFMYWHYWFGNGRRLLEHPFNEVLSSGKPDFPFCLGWANHSWSSKTWTAKSRNGKPTSHMLMEQLYPGIEDYTNHFYSVLPAFKDPRYIKIDNKPFFLIYDILGMPDPVGFMQLWKDLAQKNGLEGIHFVGNVMGGRNEKRCEEIINSGVDSTVLSNLVYAQSKIKGERLGIYFQKLKSRLPFLGVEKYAYKDIIRCIHNDYEYMDNVYPEVFPQLDRTPRAGRHAVIFTGATPDLFKKYLQETVDIVSTKKNEEHRVIILNAWNEWGEGNYVEPDMKYGRGFLDAIKEVILGN